MVISGTAGTGKSYLIQATLKRLKRGDENELRETSLYLYTASLYLCTVSLYLEKVVANRTARVCHGDGRSKKSKTRDDGNNHTAQVGPGDGGRKKSKKKKE